MRVLQINAVYNLSSTGRTTTELHKALLEKGHESYVAYSKTNKPDDENLYKIGSLLDCKIHALLSRITGKQGYYSHIPTLKLLKYMDKIKPDIVHLRNLHGNYINIPMLLKYLAKNRISTVITLHDFFFITGKCVHFFSGECNKWQSHCEKCPNLDNGNITWVFDRTSEMFRDKKELLSAIPHLTFVGVSKWTADEAKKSPIAASSDEVMYIYNWIDLSKFTQKDSDLIKKEKGFENKFVILGVASGWGEKRKKVDDFIELAERLPDDSRIVLVGNMPEKIKLPENVVSVGATNSVDELIDYYNMADVFLTVSLAETFGKVSAEALACGTPVVCYNSTANPEIVGEKCGYVVEENDLDGVMSAVNEIKSNGKAYYSEHCIAYAHENFDKDKNINKYIELYQKLIDG